MSTSTYSRHHSIIYRGTKEQVDAWNDRLARLTNKEGISQEIILLESLEDGLQRREDKKTESGEYSILEVAAAKKAAQQRDEERQMRALSALWENIGVEQFMEWCETETEISKETIQHFLDNHTWRNEDLRWNTRARRWLEELLVGGNPLPTNEIRSKAIADSIIGDSDEDWRRLRVLASRMGLTKTNVYGSWCLTKEVT